MYKFYATILDSFQRYLDSDSDEALQELIDKINRKPFTSELAEKGTAFNEVVDLGIAGRLPKPIFIHDKEVVVHGEFFFLANVVSEFVTKFQGALSQVRTEAILPTSKGDVLLYGVVDEQLAFKSYDIKCTGTFAYPKFNRNWQHKVYPYCFRKNGIMVETFEYTVTDYSRMWTEEYVWNESVYVPQLASICERFIGFLESKKEFITDKKVFGNE